MDEALKRRLLGAAVLLLLAFGLSLLLPGPDHRPGEASQPVVAYDLRTGAPLNLPSAEPPPPPVKLKPVEIGAIVPLKPEPEKTEPKVGPPKAELPKAEAKPAPAPAPAPPAAAPASKPATQAGPAPATASPAKPGRPALKVDESFGVSAGASWYVQIGSFSSKDNARAEQMKLARLGLPAILQGITVGKKLWYRVRVGPYPTEAPAQQALTTVRAHGYTTAKVARPDAGAN